MIGGFTGLSLSSAAMDTVYHDSYYVVGHFHLVLSIAALYGLLIALKVFIGISLVARPNDTANKAVILISTAGVL